MGNVSSAEEIRQRTGFLPAKPADTLSIGEVIVFTSDGFVPAGIRIPDELLPPNLRKVLVPEKLREGCRFEFDGKAAEAKSFKDQLEHSVEGLVATSFPKKDFVTDSAWSLALEAGASANPVKIEAAFAFSSDNSLAIRVEGSLYVGLPHSSFHLGKIKEFLQNEAADKKLYGKPLAVIAGEVWSSRYSHHSGSKNSWSATAAAEGKVLNPQPTGNGKLSISSLKRIANVVEGSEVRAVFSVIPFSLSAPKRKTPASRLPVASFQRVAVNFDAHDAVGSLHFVELPLFESALKMKDLESANSGVSQT